MKLKDSKKKYLNQMQLFTRGQHLAASTWEMQSHASHKPETQPSCKLCAQVHCLAGTCAKSSAVTRVGETVLVVTDLEGHPRSMTFILSARAHATSY